MLSEKRSIDVTFGKRGDRWGAGRAAIIACVIAVSILTAQLAVSGDSVCRAY